MTSNPIRILAIPALLLLLAGCRGEDLKDLCDAGSLARLEALSEDAPLLISLHGSGLPQEVAGARSLEALDTALLVLAPRGRLSELDGLDGLRRAVVWGDEAALGRLDARLRPDLLAGLEASGGDFDAVAVFADGAAPPRADLEALGLRVGSVIGGVATLSGPSVALLDLLVRDDLLRLERPALDLPTRNPQRTEP